VSSRQFLVDAATRHKVFLQRYAGGQSKKARQHLKRWRSEILARLAEEGTEFRRDRLSLLLADIDALTSLTLGMLAEVINESSLELARLEADTAVSTFSKASAADFSGVSDNQLFAAVRGISMPVEGAGVSVSAVLAKFTDSKTKQIAEILSDSFVMGDTIDQASKKVSDIIGSQNARQVDAIVRTITNSISIAARSEVLKANTDIASQYQWLSALDSRTTLICASRDGQRWDVGLGPLPPAHYNCRSDIIPIVEDKYNLGSEITGTRASKGAEGGKQVDAKTTYGGWLKKQPVEFVDEVLGKKRSQLFRSGKLKIDQFVDPTGKTYTLDQLESMHDIEII